MSKNFLVTRKSGPSTHVLLDGGILNVPWDQNKNFYNAYVSDILHGKRLCIAEKRLKRFKFFLDIDFYSKDETERLDYVKLSEELHRIVDEGDCLIAAARPREVTDKGTKYGIHIIWPDTSVSFQKAQSLRLKVLRELGDEWSQAIDGITSALRMLWSFKDEPGSTYYFPFGKVSLGTLTKFGETVPTPEFIEMFTIHVKDGDHDPVQDICVPNEGLEKFITDNIRSLKITKINKCKDKVNWFIGTDSRYCENIRGEHRSNHVWFCLGPNGILSQRCLDENCKKFKGRKYKVPHMLVPKDDILASSSNCSLYDYFPDGWSKEKFMET